jgi:AcrR family transcriptional regulator
MPRPRIHDIDELLDVAEQLITDSGLAGLTLRGLAAAAGVSNGSIYHAFASKDSLLAHAWLRAARRLYQFQIEGLDTAVTNTLGTDAVVTAALAPVRLATSYPASARLFFAQRRDQLFSADLPVALSAELDAAQSEFTGLLRRLADLVWSRHDRAAVESIAACIVDLPTGLLRRHLMAGEAVDELVGRRIEAATRAILALPLGVPPPRSTDTQFTTKGHQP